jgi:hexosaminidase
MKKYLLFFICLLQPTWGLAQVALLPLMPYPQSIEQQAGQLLLNSNWKVNIEGKVSADVKNTLDIFVARASAQTGKKNRWEKVRYKKANLFVSVIDPTPISNYVKDWDEAYQLTINGDRIELHAQQLLGMQRGLETLLQLIGTAPEIRLPMLTIKDKPRFKWRGLLLDTSRHFFSVTTIKRQIDAMALAKYNIFHWHLTDDQGWRFESKKYPNLHKMASDGEFYTREQMADVVAYARARGIQVLPEIDMPGHASAIAVAYPELMSAPGPYTMEYHWGVHKPTLNPANENTYAFADAIVAEVAELFPFEYLHIGGDEVDPEHWNTNSSIQAFMKEHELKDHRALQAYFNQRLQIILQKHQRKMIGWDEIQHPDLPKDIVIHSWRGPDSVSDAVSHGFQAILSTGYYLDQPQSSAYHYRNDPIPPPPVLIEKFDKDVSASTWRFAMPRKRGKPVTGTFTLIKTEAENKNAVPVHGYIDFSGKSRREIKLNEYTNNSARFSLDTWMGPVEFQVNFIADKLQGSAIVGNSPYVVTGEKIVAQKQVASHEVATHLSAQQEALILGGEAALWVEMVDEQTIDLRLWPRAFIVAERLWSARELQDEISMYDRSNLVASLAEKSVGLRHRVQQLDALQRLAAGKNVTPLLVFVEALEPAHYYHRHHEKSTHETYSKLDPLNRLADALPAESETVRVLNKQLGDWLQAPEKNAQYFAIREKFEHWVNNRDALQLFIADHPDWSGLAGKTNAVAIASIELMDKRLKTSSLMQSEQNKVKKLVQQAQMLDQEIVVAAASSLEIILNSFTAP